MGRIHGHVLTTPLLLQPELSRSLQREVWLKIESLQITGSFKVRGAANRLLALSPEEQSRGVVACSSGNHARAVAYTARRLEVDALLFVPDWVDPAKLKAIEAEGARVVRVEGGYDEAEDHALERARSEGRALIHPFDDPHVVAGQGTLGLEILEALPDDAPPGDVLVPLSGGGLAAGVGLVLEQSRHRLVTVSADRAAVMRASLHEGRQVTRPEHPTLASALSGGIGRPNRVTFPLLRRLPAIHLEVEERGVEDAVVFAYRALDLVVEGGGAVGLAALRDGRGEPVLPGPLRERSGPLVVVISGGNLDPHRLIQLLER
jgi:threonine dehydratase